MLWHNKTGLVQVFYDKEAEPVFVKPNFAVNDLDLMGMSFPSCFVPFESIYEILTNKPDASICLVRTSSIGDILLMAPMFYCIKELFPECIICFSTVSSYGPLFQYSDIVTPVKDKLIEYQGYHVGYDFNLSVERAEGAGWGREYHRSAIYAKLLGIELEDYQYRYVLHYSKKEENMADEILHLKGYNPDLPLVGLQLRGANLSRSLRFGLIRNIAKRLASYANVALIDHDISIGWEGENILNLCGLLGVLELAAVIDKCDLAVSTDSGVTHIAGALGKKNVAFFGCIPKENRVKYPHCTVVDLARGWGCEPCWEGGEKCGRRWSCVQEADENIIFEEIMKTGLL